MLRQNKIHKDAFAPAAKPFEVDLGGWKSALYNRESIDQYPMGQDTAYTSEIAMSGKQQEQKFQCCRRKFQEGKSKHTASVWKSYKSCQIFQSPQHTLEKSLQVCSCSTCLAEGNRASELAEATFMNKEHDFFCSF